MAEWEMQHLGDIAQLTMGQSPRGSLVKEPEGGLPFLQGNGEFGAQFPMARFECDDAPRRSAPGDSLISVRAPVGDINRSDRGYGIGRGLAAVTFKSVDSDFGHYAIIECSRHLHRVSQGTTFSAIGRAELAALQLPVPPLEEQRRIAEILDTIDETIRATEGVITKLELVRLGVREQFCAYRASASRYRRLSELVEAVVDCPHSTPKYRSFGVLAARTMHIKNGRFAKDDASRVSEDTYRQRVARMVPSAGDVVLTREAPVGEAFTIPRKMRICLGQRVVLIRPGPDLLGQYLVELIYSSQGRLQIRQLVAGTTNPHLNVDDIRKLAFDVPPLDEQRRALGALGAASGRIEAEEAKLEKYRRTRYGLATDLLSGRVRTVAL